jgi:DNA primase small subunit
MTAALLDTAPMEAEATFDEPTTTKDVKKSQAVVFSPELLSMYYSRLFPYHLMHEWLSYDPLNTSTEKLFSRREFSFTIEIGGEEIYIRYQSYTKQADFQAAILQRKPMKIDIGAVFSHPPKDHKSIAQGFKTEQRELVFDIDLTDYDDVRQCGCSGAKICGKCWQMMTMAVKVMEQGLREDFGFEHIAWFYSGRRGVHAWVCDEKARTLSNEARSAVATYFEVSILLYLILAIFALRI